MIEFEVNGMTCGHCARTITSAVQSADQTAKVEVDIPNRRVRIESSRHGGELLMAIQNAGYAAARV